MASVGERLFHRWCIFPGAQVWNDVEARPGVGNVSSARSRRWVSRKSSQERPSTRGKMESRYTSRTGQNVGSSLDSLPESLWVAMDGVRNQACG